MDGCCQGKLPGSREGCCCSLETWAHRWVTLKSGVLVGMDGGWLVGSWTGNRACLGLESLGLIGWWVAGLDQVRMGGWVQACEQVATRGCSRGHPPHS
jgi:hypothetical protein